jgi:Ca-activated chloride channel family protein
MKRLLLLGLMAACADSGSADSSAPGGGNVSFGGQQDIGEFRGILEAGQIPGPSTLDANGFFNEHYVAPPTDCTTTLCMTPGVSVGRDWLTGAHQATLQIAVNTNVDPTTITRKPLNLVVVVDHSGSMWDDQRIDKVKSGLHTLVQNLGADDRLALVQFDDRVDVLVPFAETLDKPHLDQVIDNLTPRGATDIYDGLEQGFELAATSFSSDRQNRVIFLSDGMATAGNTSQTDIIAMADRYVTDGIGLTTIGVGLSFDVQLMRGLAEHGSGNFYFLEDAAAASEVFTQELDYFVTPLALDVHVDATSGAGWQFGEVIGSTLWKSTTGTGSMTIPAVFVASRTSQPPEGGRRGGGSMLFIHLTPTGMNPPDGKVADLKLTYRLPGSSEIQTQTITLAYPANPSEIPQDTYLSTPEMAERYAMYNIFLGLRAATNAYDHNCAAAELNATKANAQTWNATHEDPDTTADLQLIDLYLTNLRAYGGSGDTTLDTCSGASDPYGYGNDEYYGDDTQMGCMSAGGNSRGLVPILFAVAFVVRRRRRA